MGELRPCNIRFEGEGFGLDVLCVCVCLSVFEYEEEGDCIGCVLSILECEVRIGMRLNWFDDKKG